MDHLSKVQIGLGLFLDFQKFGLRFTPLVRTDKFDTWVVKQAFASRTEFIRSKPSIFFCSCIRGQKSPEGTWNSTANRERTSRHRPWDTAYVCPSVLRSWFAFYKFVGLLVQANVMWYTKSVGNAIKTRSTYKFTRLRLNVLWRDKPTTALLIWHKLWKKLLKSCCSVLPDRITSIMTKGNKHSFMNQRYSRLKNISEKTAPTARPPPGTETVQVTRKQTMGHLEHAVTYAQEVRCQIISPPGI